MKKRIIPLLWVSSLLCMLLTGCAKTTDNGQGRVYYLNFKPEQDAAWQALATQYTQETGVEVKVVTAASGTYEETLTAQIDKTDAPTLFQISGEVAYASWKDYCADLSDSAAYRELTSDDFALKADGKVYGIAYVYEGYGLIVNKALLGKAGYTIEEITDFASLKRVAEDIHARADELGFDAFTSSTLDDDSSWRFSGHLANIPLYYEFEENGVTAQPATVEGKYLDAFKRLWDLYTQNATVSPSKITTAVNAAEEFVAGKGVFYQNGTWAYGDVKAIGDENLGFLPIYAGIDDENQGLSYGTENYWAVNSRASEADRQATLDFLQWVVTSDAGTTALAQSMGFVAPFKNAKPVENVLSNVMNDYVKEGRYNVSWAFGYTPNVAVWRSELTSALAAYTTGKGDWAAVEKAFVEGWAEQYRLSHS